MRFELLHDGVLFSSRDSVVLATNAVNGEQLRRTSGGRLFRILSTETAMVMYPLSKREAIGWVEACMRSGSDEQQRMLRKFGDD